tara:strand:- start:1504 stop:1935 length:432 start_codon:yes stop_codon:yes gene_type:complete
MHKKAQGLSLNTIVIGAVVLIVLLILVGVFSGYFGKFVPGFMAGAEKTCPDEQIKNECDFEIEKPVFGNFNPPLDEGKVCCRLKDLETDDDDDIITGTGADSGSDSDSGSGGSGSGSGSDLGSGSSCFEICGTDEACLSSCTS